MALTGVDLLVAAHTIGVHDALEAGREAVGTDERGGHVPTGDAVNHGAHTCLALGHPTPTQASPSGAAEAEVDISGSWLTLQSGSRDSPLGWVGDVTFYMMRL